MVKNHLKRIAAPKTWNIQRKEQVFTIKPKPSGHSMPNSVAVTVLFRDMFKRVKTTKEMKFILNNKQVMCNHSIVSSYRKAVGFMDVITIPQTNENFRLLFDKKGHINAVAVDDAQSKLMLLKVTKKTMMPGGKLQVNCSNGFNLRVDAATYMAGDTLAFDMDKKVVTDCLKLEKSAVVYFTSGKYVGTTATVEEITEKTIQFKHADIVFEADKRSARKSIFIIGKNGESMIKLAD